MSLESSINKQFFLILVIPGPVLRSPHGRGIPAGNTYHRRDVHRED